MCKAKVDEAGPGTWFHAEVVDLFTSGGAFVQEGDELVPIDQLRRDPLRICEQESGFDSEEDGAAYAASLLALTHRTVSLNPPKKRRRWMLLCGRCSPYDLYTTALSQ